MIRDSGGSIINISYVVDGVVGGTAEGTGRDRGDISCASSKFRVYVKQVGESDTTDSRGDARALASAINRSVRSI